VTVVILPWDQRTALRCRVAGASFEQPAAQHPVVGERGRNSERTDLRTGRAKRNAAAGL